jgi:flavin reductase (DIM6/NTAB) family NADH-FMN oxidoreductase RutF
VTTPSVDAHRAAMARLACGVAVLAVARPTPRGHQQLAATITSLTSVSLEPPLVLACVHADSRVREVLDDVPTWAVSILDATAEADADWLATPGRPVVDQLAPVPHRLGAASGAALLDRAQAWLECRTVWVRSAGDHDVVVGEVLTAQVAPGDRGALVHRLGRVRTLV